MLLAVSRVGALLTGEKCGPVALHPLPVYFIVGGASIWLRRVGAENLAYFWGVLGQIKNFAPSLAARGFRAVARFPLAFNVRHDLRSGLRA